MSCNPPHSKLLQLSINRGVLIGVGGCVASQEGEAIIARAPYVDVVFGPQTLHRLPELMHLRNRFAKDRPGHEMALLATQN